MIAFEVVDKRGGFIKPIVVCDCCRARIIGQGNALWIMPPAGGSREVESPIFHTHKHCNRTFEAHYRERFGPTDFFSAELWEHLAQLLNNATTRDDKAADRVYRAAKMAAGGAQ